MLMIVFYLLFINYCAISNVGLNLEMIYNKFPSINNLVRFKVLGVSIFRGVITAFAAKHLGSLISVSKKTELKLLVFWHFGFVSLFLWTLMFFWSWQFPTRERLLRFLFCLLVLALFVFSDFFWEL